MFDYFKISKFLLLLPMVGIVLVTTSTLFPFIVGKYTWFRVFVSLALIVFLLGLLFDRNSSVYFKRLFSMFCEPIVIAVTLFVAIFLLSGFLGIDPSFSFWSNFERGEGGLQLIHFWVFFILLVTLFREEKDWQRLLKWAIAGGLLMAAYGFFAAMDLKGFIGPRFGEQGFRFQGSIGNPAYVATYAIFMLFYVAYLFIQKYKGKIRSAGSIGLASLFLIFLVVFFAAATRGSFVGLFVAIVAALGYIGFASKRWRKKTFIAGIVLLALLATLVMFRNTPFVKSIPGSRIFDLSFSAQTFEDRAIMWKTAWDGFKERPLLGWGPENFLQVFDRHFNIKYFKPSEGFGAWFDRAHSIYFDYLVEIGALGLLSYLGIFLIFYILLFRRSALFSFRKLKIKNSTSESHGSFPLAEQALFFAFPLAYLVQGLVLFDVSPIYLNIFLFLAFATYKFESIKFQAPKNR